MFLGGGGKQAEIDIGYFCSRGVFGGEFTLLCFGLWGKVSFLLIPLEDICLVFWFDSSQRYQRLGGIDVGSVTNRSMILFKHLEHT